MVLWLKSEEVAPLLDMPKAIEVTEAAFLEQGRGLAVCHAPYAVVMAADQAHETSGPLMRQRLRVVSGGLLDSGKAGLRVGPRNGGASLALLYDSSGELLSVMGYPFGSMRTAATIGVAVKHMAPADAERVGLMGTGSSALSLLEAVMCVRNVGEIRVYSRNAEHRETFCERASETLGFAVEPAADPRDVFAAMDIVLTATNAREPAFQAEWLEPPTHLSSMGPITEVPPEAFRKADLAVVASRENERNHYYFGDEVNPIERLVREGKLSWDDIHDLGDVVVGNVPVGRGTTGVSVFHESGGGFGDVALAAAAYAEARRQDLGQWLTV